MTPAALTKLAAESAVLVSVASPQPDDAVETLGSSFSSKVIETILCIHICVFHRDGRMAQKVMKQLNVLRKACVEDSLLHEIVKSYISIFNECATESGELPKDEEGGAFMKKIAYLLGLTEKDVKEPKKVVHPTIEGYFMAQAADYKPEIEAFFAVLCMLHFKDKKEYEKGISLAVATVERLSQYNRRSLDIFAAKAYFCYAYIFELSGRSLEVRQTLLAVYRKASIHKDLHTQATALNALLRNYLLNGHYSLALKLVTKTSFSDNLKSHAQSARYLYYIGLLQAVQLEYSASHAKLHQALRKLPKGSSSANGFRLAATKLAVIVELLMGDIPERSTFTQKDVCGKLSPYFVITSAVRAGDLKEFSAIVANHESSFRKDNTLFLIRRLHQSVIRAGLCMMNNAYSKITLADVASKLGLDSVEDAETIVAKAIVDGMINATINHDCLSVEFENRKEVYGTDEPVNAFSRRIAFCLQLHAEAVKAMRYPQPTGNEKLEKSAEARYTEEDMYSGLEDGFGDDLDPL